MDWRRTAARLDRAVDRRWAEPFRLVPWRTGELDEGAPDTARPVVETTGVLMLGDEINTGLVGDVRGRGASFEPRVATGDASLGVMGEHLGNTKPQQGDRVHMLDPKRTGTTDEFFVVISAIADAADWWTIALARSRG